MSINNTFSIQQPNNLKRYACRFISCIGLYSLLFFSHSLQAHPNECANISAPAIFLSESELVCLQKIKVVNGADIQFYKVALQWLGAAAPTKFSIISVEPDSADADSHHSFSVTTGILSLSTIDIPTTYGTERYAANFVFKQENGINLFELSTANVYDNPNYIPKETWKPFGMLSADERRAVDLLGQSLPYAQLADAIYDFSNNTIGAWQLIQQESKDSGMQAGLFNNNETGELVLAFRGTESCEFPCSFAETKESVLDLAADALLSFGESGPQFRHAFNFAQQVLDNYPEYKITVTGHSLGGGLAQAVGAVFQLKTFAFNSAPVPADFFVEHPTSLTADELNNIIHVISDIRDPVSHADDSGQTYLNANHAAPLIHFDFDAKEVQPETVNRLADLYALRFKKHGMTELFDNASALIMLYQQGW
ncbi:MAG: hypothetical protein methR_P2072 [Methyloprofundus sp.]|nr:MAG: hypothetical protein methR_P2072 [Methyloprofundus sp.]